MTMSFLDRADKESIRKRTVFRRGQMERGFQAIEQEATEDTEIPFAELPPSVISVASCSHLYNCNKRRPVSARRLPVNTESGRRFLRPTARRETWPADRRGPL